MKFLQAIGLTPTVEVPSEAYEVLLGHCESFLRAFGSLSITDWRDLSESERKAFAEAGDRIRLTDVANQAFANQSNLHAALLMKSIDGGESFYQLILEDKVNEIHERTRFSWER